MPREIWTAAEGDLSAADDSSLGNSDASASNIEIVPSARKSGGEDEGDNCDHSNFSSEEEISVIETRVVICGPEGAL